MMVLFPPGGTSVKQYPAGFPHFETEEQMHAMIREGLESSEEGSILIPSPEWDLFCEELLSQRKVQKLAS